jgi:Xaa-Pro aminopeptidase
MARPAPTPAASREYYTDEEIEYLRDAQGLEQRVPAILRLANIRLVSLYMKEKSKEDKELEKKIAEIHEELSGRPPAKPTPVPPPKPGEKPRTPAADVSRPYLNDLSRTELLRGYIEALEEIKTVIDDAYRDKQDVRGVLEQFEKFLRESNPLLRRFQSKSDDEFQAILDAKSATEESLDDAQDALKKVPKTEKSTRP